MNDECPKSATVDRLSKIVEGPDHDPEKGLILKVDRVAQIAARLERILWLVVGLIAVNFATLLLQFIQIRAAAT